MMLMKYKMRVKDIDGRVYRFTSDKESNLINYINIPNTVDVIIWDTQRPEVTYTYIVNEQYPKGLVSRYPERG